MIDVTSFACGEYCLCPSDLNRFVQREERFQWGFMCRLLNSSLNSNEFTEIRSKTHSKRSQQGPQQYSSSIESIIDLNDTHRTTNVIVNFRVNVEILIEFVWISSLVLVPLRSLDKAIRMKALWLARLRWPTDSDNDHDDNDAGNGIGIGQAWHNSRSVNNRTKWKGIET